MQFFANCTVASMEDSCIISIPYCDIDNQATYYFSVASFNEDNTAFTVKPYVLSSESKGEFVD